LEICPRLGTVFLDEVGDIETGIPVKLLRVLQTRTFQRLGENRTRHFQGKIITATNRNVTRRMQEGAFREDLYYRLCSYMIETPSLHERLQDSPEELQHLILFIARRVAGDQEGEALAREVEDWISSRIGMDYRWPGNVRELEQCVRNVMIRRAHHPVRAPLDRGRTVAETFVGGLNEGGISAEELLRCYCALVYAQTGSFQETARRLNIDRRTVKSKIDPQMLEEYRRLVGP